MEVSETEKNTDENPTPTEEDSPVEVTPEMRLLNLNGSADTPQIDSIPNSEKTQIDDASADNSDKPKPSIVYKVDAEEFIPRAMRSSSHDSSCVAENISPELRAKFENYLNRHDQYVFTPSVSLPEVYPYEEFVGSSYPPPKTHYLPPHLAHDMFMGRKPNTFNNSYKKRQRFTKPNYYPKQPYRKQETDKCLKTQTSQTDLVDPEIVTVETISIEPVEIPKVVETDVVEQIKEVLPEKEARPEANVEEIKSTKETKEVPTPKEIVCKSKPVRQSSVAKVSVQPEQVIQVSGVKNYAQILRKEEPKTVISSSNQSFKKPETSPLKLKLVPGNQKRNDVRKNTRPVLVHSKSVPTTPKETQEDSEWISVPSRKKGKTKIKEFPQNNYSTSFNDSYLNEKVITEIKTPEKIPERIEEPKEVIEEVVEEQPQVSTKSSPVKKQKSVTKTTPNKSKKQGKQTIEKVEKVFEKAKTPPLKVKSEEPESVKKTSKNKTKKASTSKEGTPSLTHQVPNNIAIGESIDNLRKLASEEYAETNLDITQEMDRMIQQGLYKNLGDKIKAFDQDNQFLSLMNHDVSKLPLKPHLPKLSTENSNIFDFDLMETLGEYQKLLSNKGSTENKTLTGEKNFQETSTSSELVEVILPIESSKMTVESELSENDDTLLSVKFDSIENIAIDLPEEPEIPRIVEIHSPDPDSWSSHTNLTTTNADNDITEDVISTSEYSTANNIMTKSLTEVVTEWLHEAKEKSPPDVDILKSPEKIYREKSAPPSLYRQYSSGASGT